MADGSLSGTVNVPLVGKTSKKTAAAGLGVVGVLVIVYYIRKNKARSATSAAAAASTAANQYPPDGTTGNPQDPYSTDPATGQTYGDEATGSGGLYGSFGTGSSPYGYTTGYPFPGSVPPSSATGGPPFSSNSQWSQYVIQTIEGQNPNQDVGALTNALGLYLEGQQVDPGQQQLIFDARAIAGDPPVPGPNGYPPNLHLNGNKGPGGSGPTSPYPTPSNLHATTYPTAADLAWSDPAGNSIQYHVWVGQGQATVFDQQVTGGHARVTGLKPSASYQWRVAADQSATNLASAWSPISTFKTQA